MIGLAPSESVLRRRRANAKGKRLEKLAQTLMESRGWLVQPARRRTVWLPKAGGGVFPRMMEADFFECWDMMIVKGRVRAFAQVTVLIHVAHKRTKIRLSKFPAKACDLILGYEGRLRWRVLTGPDFAMPGETWTQPRGSTVHAPKSRMQAADFTLRATVVPVPIMGESR